MDAVADSSKKVILSFVERSVPKVSVPGIDGLTRAVEACLDRAKKRRSDKELEFFRRAHRLLAGEQLRIIQIDDSGTTGLQGPCEQGTPFHALVKASGVSEKADPTAVGSFGIGKNAAYAISALRTVFYSTVYESSVGSESFLAQGKAILVSHHSEDGIHHLATGYWGTGNYQPIDSTDLIPEWLRKSCRGTQVTAIGFEGETGWEFEVVDSLIRNFFVAIHRKQIEFAVHGGIRVDEESIASLFHEKAIITAAARHGFEEELRFCSDLYACLTSPDVYEFERDIENIGRLKLHLLVRDGLPKRVAIIRHGMYITDSLKHFGDRLARFALQKDFVAILEPMDRQAASLIRRLENPKHDELSPERLQDPVEQKRVRAAFRTLIAWVRESIREKTSSPPEDEVLLDELNEFFASPADADRIQDPGNDERDPERLTFKPLKVHVSSSNSERGGAEGGGGGLKNSSQTKGGRGQGRGDGDGQGGTGNRNRENPLTVHSFRNVTPTGVERRFRDLFFTPASDGLARLELLSSGMAEPVKLPIRSIDGERLEGRPATVELRSGSRVRLRVELFVDYDGPIEVSLTELAAAEVHDEAQ